MLVKIIDCYEENQLSQPICEMNAEKPSSHQKCTATYCRMNSFYHYVKFHLICRHEF